MKYRIISNGKKFKAQYSRYGIFWNNIKFFSGGKYYAYRDTITDAEKAIEDYKLRNATPNRNKWNVVKKIKD